ncbi:site-specific integrase [Chitinophaga sp. S165]|uniref:tyrosine-type recombinase/integrase n=1 Tax=Chitinophaga sp. S165 TaxID=2135462 RepID=UPI000D717BCF|nr:site-specific integrase [Chitinophaga sp. S165]PWV47047.1 site-specific recombinase XerD [Chitinophaga sp. S165]
MNYQERVNERGDKIYLYYDNGREAGQRKSTGYFLYTNPRTDLEKNHNVEMQRIIDVQKAQVILDQQAIGTGYIPNHRVKRNFLEYYEQFVSENKRVARRHLECCFSRFKKFIKRDVISPLDITHALCQRFRQHLLDTLTGETPQNYFATFKRMMENATQEGYFKVCPTDKLPAIRNPSVKLKSILEVEDYLALLKVPPPAHLTETIEAFIFCLYTGLRYCDIAPLRFSDFNGTHLTTRLLQAKTKQPVILHLHPIAAAILRKRRRFLGITPTPGKLLFQLSCLEACNKVIKAWCRQALGSDKEVTWSCCRLSYSVLLKDAQADDATIAYLLGHTTTNQVQRTYKRHRPKDAMGQVIKLPAPKQLPHHLSDPDELAFEECDPAASGQAVPPGPADEAAGPEIASPEIDDDGWIEL